MSPPPSRARRLPRTASALTLAAVLGGCSFKVIKPAPPASEWSDPTSAFGCTNKLGVPIADTIISGGFGTLAYVERNSGSPVISLALGVAAVPFLVSAVYGYIQTARCASYESRFAPLR